MSIWDQLATHHKKNKNRPILSLFTENPNRFDAYSFCLDDMLLDISKTNIDEVAFSFLKNLARDQQVEDHREAMFSGQKINETENRAVLHTALRNISGDPVLVDGHDVMPDVKTTLNRMRAFSIGVRNGEIAASDGGRFTDIVNIGIGGSDLGPAMACKALAPYCDGPKTNFISNVDGADAADTLDGLDPNRVLLIIASKTFTTIETMTNAKTALGWLEKKLGQERAKSHLVALSSAPENTSTFGVDPSRVFGFQDWVGGRYSVWGPIGLSLMIATGPDDFQAFLTGAHDMDQHFRDAPLDTNMPVALALIGIWHSNICGYDTRAVLPYDERLLRLPAYLQQLDMESNGKSVAMDGHRLERASGPVVWGEPGTNGQHAFYQLIHQGTRVIPCEFLVARQGHEPELAHQHRLLVANCLAQSEALLTGRNETTAQALMRAKGLGGAEMIRQARHRVFEGNRPSVTLLYDKLTPENLGRILALFEHRVFVEGVIWGLNSFDQWGVELGKNLATEMLPFIESGEDPVQKDGSTRGLLRTLHEK